MNGFSHESPLDFVEKIGEQNLWGKGRNAKQNVYY